MAGSDLPRYWQYDFTITTVLRPRHVFLQSLLWSDSFNILKHYNWTDSALNSISGAATVLGLCCGGLSLYKSVEVVSLHGRRAGLGGFRHSLKPATPTASPLFQLLCCVWTESFELPLFSYLLAFIQTHVH